MEIDAYLQNIIVADGRYDNEKRYWQNKFSDGVNPSMFYPDYNETEDEFEVSIETYSQYLKREVSDLLNKINKTELGLYIMLMAGIEYTVRYLTNDENVMIGMPPFIKENQTVVNNMLIFNNQVFGNETFQELLQATKQIIKDVNENSNYPLIHIADELRLRSSAGKIILNIECMLQNIQYKDEDSIQKADICFCFNKDREGIKLDIIYNANRYRKTTVLSLLNFLETFFIEACTSSKTPLDELNYISAEQKIMLLDTFNNTKVAYDEDITISAFFERKVEEYGNNKAVIFEEQLLTYKQFNVMVNNLASRLREEGVGRNTIVAIISDKSFEMMLAIYAIIKAGGTYLPISAQYPNNRIEFIIEDSKAKVLLVQENYIGLIHSDIKRINLNDRSLYEGEGKNPDAVNNSKDAAYIIYTSGTTGMPKGVVIRHFSVMNRIGWMQKKYSLTSSDVVLQKTPYTFDVSVWEIFWWFFAGASVCLLKSGDEKIPEKITNVINKNKVSVLHFVPSMLSVFLEYLSDGSKTDKIKSIRHVFASGEALKASHCKEFERVIHNILGTKLHNLYGPTEATVDVSYYECSEHEINRSVPIGKPIDNIQLYVLNDKQKLLPIGFPGELYIAGDGLAKGYLNRSELTGKKFLPNPFTANEVMYQTGDLVRMQKDGNIEYISRLDHQVKIRGLRVELGEIETQIINTDLVKNAVVIVVEHENDNKYLCVFYTAEDELVVSEIKNKISKQLPDYMIPDSWVYMNDIPVTANGKLDRKMLLKRKQEKEVQKNIALPETNMQHIVLDIWKEILHEDKIGIDDNFFEIGGHSIAMLKISERIRKQFGIKIEFSEFMTKLTVRTMSAIIEEREPENGAIFGNATFDLININQPFELTQVQSAYLYGRNVNFEMGGGSTHTYTEIEDNFDISRLNAAFNKLILRHSMLRAIFLLEGKQKILEQVEPYQIEINDLTTISNEEKEQYISEVRNKMSHQVFEPDQWPLFAIKALKIDEFKYRLCVGFDTLIADGESMQILFHELNTLYTGREEELEEIKFSFRDYVLEYNKIKNSGKYNEDKAFWMERLKDMSPAPELVLKTKPETIKIPKFNRITQYIDGDKWRVIKEKAKHKAITPSALLCTLYADVLAHWCNQKNLTINLTVFNRLPFHKDVNKIVGDFTSVMLCEIKCIPSLFWEQVQSVQQSIFEGLEHKYYDGIELIREYATAKHLGNRNLFPVVFTCALYEQDTEMDKNTKDNILDTLKVGISQTSQVYLDHQASEINGGLNINWDYAEDLLDEKYVTDMFQCYINAIYDISLDRTPVFASQSMKLYDEYNPKDEMIQKGTLHHQFMLQARKTPKNAAVIHDDEQITYEQLDERSDIVAGYLQSKGLGKGEFVAVYAKRCIDSIVNILGILKAGAAYIPVDPDYPEDRKNYMIQHSNCKMMLYPEKKYTCSGGTVCLTDIQSGSDDIAYVIYTSGSTGNPKGVVITHNGALNTIVDINRKFHVNENDRIMGISSMCFDLSVYDIFGSLLSGAALVILNCIRDIDEIADKIKKYHVTIWNSVPAIMDMVVESKKKIEELEARYLWSPNIRWKVRKEKLYIENQECPPEALEMFPELYFQTQDGILLSDLYKHFPEENHKLVIKDLIENRVLIDTIQEPLDIFKSQDRLYQNNFSDEIKVDEKKYEIFKKQQLSRQVVKHYLEKINLTRDREFPSYISDRKSYRNFNKGTLIAFSIFSQFMSILSQRRERDEIRYYYASAGGLYPIDVYLYVKSNRIEGLKQGLYYFTPIDNSLKLINQQMDVPSDVHYMGNRKIFEESAFSMYFVYNSEANMPKYGSAGFYYACIDLGIMIGALTQAAEMQNIGLCSIGDMFYSKIQDAFQLKNGSVFMHCIECGLKDDQKTDNNLNILFDEEKILREKQSSQVDTGGNDLRLVMLSGDWISLTLPSRIHKIYGECEVVSLGGATEASIWSIYYPILQVENNWNSIPYGYPLCNQKMYIMNYTIEPCPIGVEGEIYIGGLGVAKGYLNEPHLTKDAFVKHEKYGILYKTGDYGKMAEEGYIIFCGRRDNQVKIRGHRIELGEIERQILNVTGIDNVVVLMQKSNDKTYLCAYFVAHGEIEISDIKDYIADKLLNYMLPSRYVKVDMIPLTVNGKVDRKKLIQENGISDNEMKKKNSVPINKIEVELSEIWKKILQIDELGREDNFFDLGGNSISLVKMYSEIDQLYPGKLKIIEMFSLTSIVLLAEKLSERNLKDNELDLYKMKLPVEYLNAVKKNKQKRGYDIPFSNGAYELVVSKAKQLKVKEEDVLLAAYMLTLSKLWKQSKVGINYLSNLDELYTLVYDLDKFMDVDVLIHRIASNKTNKDNRIGHINDYVYIQDQNEAVVGFSESDRINAADMLADYYDISLATNLTGESRLIRFVYNTAVIRTEKIGDINGCFQKILNQMLR